VKVSTQSLRTRYVYCLDRRTDRSPETRDSVNRPRGQHVGMSGKADMSEAARSRAAQTSAALSCYGCQGIGHYARECPTRQKREVKSYKPLCSISLVKRRLLNM
jgi:hypothetical protein